MRLPKWVNETLDRKKVRIEQYRRATRGRRTNVESRWYFCGWYWHREARRGFISEGPFGPFPCPSAAAADALKYYGLDYSDRPGTNANI